MFEQLFIYAIIFAVGMLWGKTWRTVHTKGTLIIIDTGNGKPHLFAELGENIEELYRKKYIIMKISHK